MLCLYMYKECFGICMNCASKNKITVMHVVSGDLWAGAEVQLFTLCKYLVRNGIEVVAVVMNHGELERRLTGIGVGVIVLDEGNNNIIQLLIKIMGIVRNIKPDMIHTHRTKENIVGGLAAWVFGISSIRTIHGGQEHHYKWYQVHRHFIRIIDTFIAKRVQDKIVAVSDDLGSELSFIYPKDKVIVIPNGVDNEIAINNIESAPIYNDKVFHVGIVGRLVEVKRVDLYIKVAALFVSKYPEVEVKFHIFGEGPLKEELIEFTNKNGLSAKVMFEGQKLNIHDYIKSLDVMVMTSDHEGLPMSLLESMILQTPVVAHDVGGISEVCEHGKCCYLIKKGDVESCAEALGMIIKNREKTRRMIDRAKKRILSCYTAEMSACRYIDEYQHII